MKPQPLPPRLLERASELCFLLPLRRALLFELGGAQGGLDVGTGGGGSRVGAKLAGLARVQLGRRRAQRLALRVRVLHSPLQLLQDAIGAVLAERHTALRRGSLIVKEL